MGFIEEASPSPDPSNKKQMPFAMASAYVSKGLLGHARVEVKARSAKRRKGNINGICIKHIKEFGYAELEFARQLRKPIIRAENSKSYAAKEKLVADKKQAAAQGTLVAARRGSTPSTASNVVASEQNDIFTGAPEDDFDAVEGVLNDFWTLTFLELLCRNIFSFAGLYTLVCLAQSAFCFQPFKRFHKQRRQFLQHIPSCNRSNTIRFDNSRFTISKALVELLLTLPFTSFQIVDDSIWISSLET